MVRKSVTFSLTKQDYDNITQLTASVTVGGKTETHTEVFNQFITHAQAANSLRVMATWMDNIKE